MNTYTLSWYCKEQVPVLKKRNWYLIFGRDTITFKEQWVRKTIHNISRNKAQQLLYLMETEFKNLMIEIYGS